MIRLETQVQIGRPIEDVFAYVADPGNLPDWNSAVQAVRKTSPVADNDVGTSYRLERELPTGRAENELEVVACERPTSFAIRTNSGPTPFGYRFRFTPEGAATIIQVDAEADLGAAADLLAPLVRRAVQRGVDDNLAALKTILEAQPSAARV
jgi:uncharacterized protein YndB with AHSA1/START domain